MKKTTKVLLSMVLIVAMVMGNTCPASATVKEKTHRSNIEGKCEEGSQSWYTENGITMLVDQFITEYTGEESTAIVKTDTECFQTVSLSVNNIRFNNDTNELNFIANIPSRNISFEAKGILRNSYKQKKGINSIVGHFDSSEEDVEILHFEIFNSNSLDLFYAREEYINRPHLKLYFCSNGQLYFFETAIPAELHTISLPKTDENQCDNMLYDGFWFAQVIPANVNVIEESGTRSTEDYQYCYFDFIYTIAGSQYHQYCTVKGTWSIVNVNTSSANPWTAGIKIINAYCTLPSGEVIQVGGISIKNMDISFATGQQTRYLYSMSSFSMFDSDGVLPIGSSITGLVAALLGFSTYGQAATAVALLSAVLSLLESSATFYKTTGTSVTTHLNDYCRALRFTYPTRYYLYNKDHEVQHFCFARASTLYQTGNMTSGLRMGQVRISFDAKYGATLIQNKVISSGNCSYYCDLDN